MRRALALTVLIALTAAVGAWQLALELRVGPSLPVALAGLAGTTVGGLIVSAIMDRWFSAELAALRKRWRAKARTLGTPKKLGGTGRTHDGWGKLNRPLRRHPGPWG